MFLGVDTSTYLEELAHGARYFDGATPVDPLDLFRANNVEYMRIRLWNRPYSDAGEPYLAGTCDLPYVIRLTHLAASKGYRILLDLHYSDFWADPGKQCVPKDWAGLDVAALTEKVYSFTKETLLQLRAEKIDVPMIQIGNEITNGILWPFGKLMEHDDGPRTNYENLCTLLKAGIRAAREVYPDIQCMLHLEKSYDQKIYDEFFTNMQKYDVPYDILGMSYYPYWHGTFEEFFANVRMCREKFCKKIVVSELGYAFTLEDYILTQNGKNNLVVNTDNVRDFNFIQQYPLTPEGQKAFVTDFLAQARAHEIMGVIWWEPAWIPGDGICWASVAGEAYIGESGKPTRNEWSNQCLFDYKGRKLPALDAFHN